jgi:SAM-dependent methyltransferase
VTRTGSEHWEAVYTGRPSDEVSWYQARPEVSLRLVTAACPGRGALVDVGAGASLLAVALLDEGWSDVTVLDLSTTALAQVRDRLAGRPGIAFVVADLLEWQPERAYDVWHDRAVLHFLTAEADRARYAATAARAVAPGGAAVIGAFALDGPESCSGLPTLRYDAQGLVAVLGPGWALEHTEREEHVTPGGAVQSFTWAVLRRTGQAD